VVVVQLQKKNIYTFFFRSFQVQLLDGSRAAQPSTVSSSDGSSTVAVICDGKAMPSLFGPCWNRSGLKEASKWYTMGTARGTSNAQISSGVCGVMWGMFVGWVELD
jgi:hypothetical protein